MITSRSVADLTEPRPVMPRTCSMRTYIIDTSRRLAAAGVFLAAVVHLDLWVQGFRSIDTIGPLFMLDFVAGMITGVGVLVWRHWLPALAAAGFGAATVVAFWISVVHGLFGVKETPSGSSEILAEIAEYSAIAFGLAVVLALVLRPGSGTARREAPAPLRAWRPRPGSTSAGSIPGRGPTKGAASSPAVPSMTRSSTSARGRRMSRAAARTKAAIPAKPHPNFPPCAALRCCHAVRRSWLSR
jgi:hypothetical protein